MNSKTTHCGVGLLAADIQVMATFYRDVLGLETDWGGGSFAEFYTASGRLALFMYDRKMFDEAMKPEFRPPRGINQTFEIGLWLPAFADVDAEYEKLKAKGVAVPADGPITLPFGIRNFYIADPEGNLLEIGSDTPN